MLRGLVNQIRPHQLVHQLAVLVVLSGFFAAEHTRTVEAAGISVLGTLAMLLFSDYQHRRDDAVMGRQRLVHVLGARRVSIGIVVSFVGLFGLAGAMGGLRCVAFLLGVFGGTASYTLAKRWRWPTASYLGRFAAGVMLVGTYRAALPGVELPAVARLAVAAGLLDLAGNLAGDLRDAVEDKRAGLRTLPLSIGPTFTRYSIVLLLLAAHGVMAGVVPTTTLVLSATGVTGFVGGVLAATPRAWQHAAVHGPKLVTLLVLGAALAGTERHVLVVVCVVVGGLWLASYRAYLWSARAVMRAECRLTPPR